MRCTVHMMYLATWDEKLLGGQRGTRMHQHAHSNAMACMLAKQCFIFKVFKTSYI